MSVLPGDPAQLATRASQLVGSAEVILTVIQELRGITKDDEGKAVQALYAQNEQISSDLDRIQPRYQGTADAITEYAVALADAHADAELAQNDLDQALVQRDHTERERSRLEGSADPDLVDLLPGAVRLVDEADASVNAARARVDAARTAMEDAAQVAIRRIDAAIDATNEGFWDQVNDFFDGIKDFLDSVWDWIDGFLKDVFNLLKAIVDTIVAILITVLILVLLFAVLGGGLLAAIVVGALAAFLLISIFSDVLKPTPKVSKVDPYADAKAEELPDDPTLAGVFDGAGEVDALGGEAESVVKITKVLGPDGWQYTVTLPSTQEWFSRFNGDHGAVNDLDSNIALMLTPALQTQYERAVLQAMDEAGITADDPVMLVGFSQGGILAGHLAAYNSDYNWQAVVVAGAPIDHMPIPDSIDVVSVQHNGDPVPRLDIVGGDFDSIQHGANWTTIRTDPPDANPVLGVDVGAHSAAKYSQTFQSQLAEVQRLHPELSSFFSDGSHTAVSYYHWSE